MESGWRAAGHHLGRRWPWVLGAAALITVVAVIGLARVEFATGQDSYLNQDSQAAIDNVEFQDAFGGETVVLLFLAEEGRDVADLFAGDNLATLDQLTADLEAVDQAHAVITPLVSLGWSDELVKGPGRQALLDAAQREPDDDGRAARNADIQVGLARVGAVADQSVGNPAWNDILVYDNTGFSIDDDGDLVAPADDQRSIRLSLATTFPDPAVAVGGVVLSGNASLDELSDGTEAVLDVIDGVELDGFELITTGSPLYLQEINDYLQGGMLTLGAIALAVMAVMLALLFRVRWRLLPLVGVIIGVIWTFAVLGFVGIDLSLVTISGLPILIGLGIDFGIQIHNRIEEETALDRDPHPIAETLANVGPALVVATIGAVGAFLALRISQVPMIRDFGVLLAVGVGVLLVAGVILPAALLGAREYRSRTDVRQRSRVERLVRTLGSVPARVAPVLAVAAVALFGVGVAVEGSVDIESDPIRWIDQDSQTVADVETLTDRAGFATTLGVLVEANNVNATEVAELVWGFTLDAESRDDVVASSSVVNTMGKIITVPGATDLAPTPADLDAAIEVMPPAIERVLVADDRTATQLNLRLAEASLEERADIVDQLSSDLQRRINALDVADDAVLGVGLAEGQDPVRAVPAGLAVVGVGLLENLSANRAVLTYLGLAIVALWFVIRHRSVARAALALVPVGMAVGLSTIVVAAAGITLSPLTTVSGPLVIATCSEFSILILARYLEERQRGLDAAEATDTAASRTGRAFFTSAATTIAGFAVLIVSPLPLLRDFGIIVSLNVAIALVAALVIMPPVVTWADGRGWLAVAPQPGAVRLATHDPVSTMGAAAATVVLVAASIGLYLAADTGGGESREVAFTAVELPTPTPAPTPTPEPTPVADEPADEAIDVTTFGTDRPGGIVGGVLFDLLTGAGADPQRAVCTAETLLDRVSEGDLLASGLATFSDEALVPVVAAAGDCGIDQATLDAAIATARGG